MVSFSMHKIDGIFWFGIPIVVVDSFGSSACDQPDTSKGQRASTHKLACIVSRGPFKVPIQNGRAQNNRQSKENKLHRDDLRRVEALECPIDVLDLHDCCADQYSHKQVSDREGDGAP